MSARTVYYFDTEFIEDGRTIDLVSIGIVCEDGREFYAESSEVDWSKASQWVLDNVKPHLLGNAVSRERIAADVLSFVGDTQPEFWAYYADYDWVALCQLFGTMMDLPDGWPMFCMDLKQLCVEMGDPQLPEQDDGEHHALEDARWNRSIHAWLRSSAVSTSEEQ